MLEIIENHAWYELESGSVWVRRPGDGGGSTPSFSSESLSFSSPRDSEKSQATRESRSYSPVKTHLTVVL